jgi:hypothetical protein
MVRFSEGLWWTGGGPVARETAAWMSAPARPVLRSTSDSRAKMHYIITGDADYMISAHDIDRLFNLIKELREQKIDYEHIYKS